MPASQRPVCPQTLAAWGLGGLTLSDLWGRYLCLGGGRPQAALAAYLDGTVAWPDEEHNLLAHALNEGLWDVGLPSLAPRRASEAAPLDGTPDTRRPSP